MWKKIIPAGILLFAALGCEHSGASTASGKPPSAKLVVTSSALVEGQPIPAQYACTDYDHLGMSPPIAWSGAPEGTVVYAITMLDPDAKGFAHWGVIDLPESATSVAAGASPGGGLPPFAKDLTNDFDKKGYGGPCPPPGSLHHYVLTVYALKKKVTATKVDAAFVAALDDAALASGSITVTFQR